jgi:hypothetical protein
VPGTGCGKAILSAEVQLPGWTNVCQAVAGVGCIAAFVNKMILPLADISLGWIRKTEVSVVLAVVTVPDDFNGRVVQCFKYTFRMLMDTFAWISYDSSSMAPPMATSLERTDCYRMARN